MIDCPVCMADGHDPLDIDWGATTVADCPCCKGKKTVMLSAAFKYITDHREKVVVLQNELDEARAAKQVAPPPPEFPRPLRCNGLTGHVIGRAP